MTKVKFLKVINGYPEVVGEVDMESLPRVNEFVEIVNKVYTCGAPKHIFEYTGRGGDQKYTVEVRVTPV